MRRSFALTVTALAGSILGLTGLVFGLTGSILATIGGGSVALAANVPPSASGFVVQPNITESGCNHGHGLKWAAHLGEIPVLATASMSDDSTLVAVSSAGSPGGLSVVLYSVTPACRPNPAFGAHGVARLMPTQPPPQDRMAGGNLDGLQIDALAPAQGGGALLAGAYGGHWMVGETTPQGKPDPSFGQDGWSVLPFAGEVTAIAERPSGGVLIAGNDGGAGCCSRNWIAALSATGAVEPAYGDHGREPLPSGEDSDVETLVLEPNGDALAPVGYGNMGCWGLALEMLTPAGQPVPSFQAQLAGFWHRLGLGAFVGDVYASGTGFTLIGTGQRPCYGSEPAASAAGLMATFDSSGRQIGSTLSFPSRSFGTAYGFADRTDALTVSSPYANSTRLSLQVRHGSGSLDNGFANGGSALVRTPWTGSDAALQTQVFIDPSGPGAITIVAQDAGGQLQLTRLDVSP